MEKPYLNHDTKLESPLGTLDAQGSQNNQDSTDINLHTLSKERSQLRGIKRDKNTPDSVREYVDSELENVQSKIKQSGFSIEKKAGGNLALREALERVMQDKDKAERGLGLSVESIKEVMGQAYDEIRVLYDKSRTAHNFEIQRLLDLKRNPHAKRVLEPVLQTAVNERVSVDQELQSLKKKDGDMFRAFELTEYKSGLLKEGHIAQTPTVVGHLEEIGTKMAVGKPMFLHGPTGTGKTSLARLASKHFTGKEAEMVYCNPQTRESNIWGKTGIRPDRRASHDKKRSGGKEPEVNTGAIKTVEIFGPLAKAMDEGHTVIFDEFTALPKEQMVFIKGVFNAKVGDKVNVSGNGQITIKPGFQMIFTANLKSEKNQERQDLPPEIAREFEQNNIKVEYSPKEESYDIMLARLMNPDGSIDLSDHDLNVTLPKLCEAMNEIQIAYTGVLDAETAKLVGAMDASGKTKGLKKMVFTQGTVEAILEQWSIEKSRTETTFAEFLDKRLAVALKFEEYPLPDRELVAKILASKGLLLTLSHTDVGLPKEVFDFSIAKSMRGKDAVDELKQKSSNIHHLDLLEVAKLDPFGNRKTEADLKAKQFLKKKSKDKSNSMAGGETLAEIEAKELFQENFLGY
jgi:MoxR-like ATPase